MSVRQLHSSFPAIHIARIWRRQVCGCALLAIALRSAAAERALRCGAVRRGAARKRLHRVESVGAQGLLLACGDEWRNDKRVH